MARCYFFLIALLVAAFPARAQFVPAGGPVTNLQVGNVTATSATITFAGGSAGSGFIGCQTIPTRITYAYTGGTPVSVPYAMPLQLTGLQPGSAVQVQVTRIVPNQLSAGPVCGPSLPATITFTTLAAPLAASAAAEAGRFTLSPNPAQGQATLTLAAALLQPTSVRVLDALGCSVRQQVLPARATTATLDLTSLAPGLYLVRCGAVARRLRVE